MNSTRTDGEEVGTEASTILGGLYFTRLIDIKVEMEKAKFRELNERLAKLWV